jgi:hypothetical protein
MAIWERKGERVECSFSSTAFCRHRIEDKARSQSGLAPNNVIGQRFPGFVVGEGALDILGNLCAKIDLILILSVS